MALSSNDIKWLNAAPKAPAPAVRSRRCCAGCVLFVRNAINPAAAVGTCTHEPSHGGFYPDEDHFCADRVEVKK